jgi:hypothetical protein
MMAWVSGLLAFAGFAAIALSMERHRPALAYRAGSTAARANMPLHAARSARWARCGGYALLALAALPATRSWGPSVGIAIWLGTLTLSAFSVMLLLAYYPGAVRALARLALLSGLLGWLLPLLSRYP